MAFHICYIDNAQAIYHFRPTRTKLGWNMEFIGGTINKLNWYCTALLKQVTKRG